MTTKNGWVLPAGVGLAMMVGACGSAGEEAVGTGESAISGSGSTSTSSSGMQYTGDGYLKLYATLDACNADIRDYDVQSWSLGGCGTIDYLASEQTDGLECIAVGQWGYAQTQKWKATAIAADTITLQGTPGCNDASNCPFYCLERDYLTRHSATVYCNTWDGTTLHRDVQWTKGYTSTPSVTFQNVHWGSGNGIYTQETDTPGTYVETEYTTPCDPSAPYTWTTARFEQAATRTHVP